MTVVVPNAIALAGIADGSSIVASDHRNNYAAVQVGVNGLIAMFTAAPTKGDLIVSAGGGSFDKLPVGANGLAVIADSTQPLGVKWASPSTTTELAYAEFTATVTATSSTEASAVTVVSAGAVAFDGATKVRIEFFAPDHRPSDTSNGLILTLFDGTTGTVIGQLHKVSIATSAASDDRGSIYAVRELTPSNASHTYFVGILDAGAATTHASVRAGAGGAGALLPGFIRIVKAA